MSVKVVFPLLSDKDFDCAARDSKDAARRQEVRLVAQWSRKLQVWDQDGDTLEGGGGEIRHLADERIRDAQSPLARERGLLFSGDARRRRANHPAPAQSRGIHPCLRDCG